MSNEEMTVVRIENDEAAGQIVASFLQSCGIEAMIAEDDAGDQIPSLETVRGVRVFVPVKDADRARELLEERESADVAD